MLSNGRHCASKGDVEGSWDITLQTLCNMRQKSKCLTRSLLTPNEAITWLWQQWSKINMASTVHCLWASNPPYLSLFSLWVIYFIRHGAFLQSKKKKKKKKKRKRWLVWVSQRDSVTLLPTIIPEVSLRCSSGRWDFGRGSESLLCYSNEKPHKAMYRWRITELYTCNTHNFINRHPLKS